MMAGEGAGGSKKSVAVDFVRERFEAEWSAGRARSIEEALAAVPDGERLELFRALLASEIELRRKAGEKLKSGPYEERFPEWKAVIREVFLQIRNQSGGSASPVTGTVSLAAASTDTSVAPRPQAKVEISPPPQRIGRFEILQVLGKGGFGTVYKGRDPKLDRFVAIKVPRAGMLQTDSDRQRFLREARAAATLTHPNICPVHEVGEGETGDYIVMAFIEGKPLSDFVGDAKLGPKQAVSVVRKLALALEEAHEKGIVHRDLKPANVMVNGRGEPIVMDFGLARLTQQGDAVVTQTGQIMGSPAYMSPEQARGNVTQIGPTSDIYSLGIVLYELLCGRRPFSGTITEVLGRILLTETPPPSQFKGGIDPALEAIVMKAISKQPGERYQSMKEFAATLAGYTRGQSETTTRSGSDSKTISRVDDGEAALQAIFADLAAEQRSASLKPQARPSRRRSRSKSKRGPNWLLIGVGGLAAVVLLGIVFFARKDGFTVVVQVPLENLKDPALSFEIDGKSTTADALALPMELKPGSHVLKVSRDGRPYKEFALSVGEASTDPVSVREQPVAASQAPAASSNGSSLAQSAPTVSPTISSAGWVDLLNGTDLTGWEQQGPERFELQDGAVMAGGSERWGRLVCVKPFDHFELTCEAFSNEKGNGGIAFHVPSFPADRSDQKGGYEFQVAGSQGDPGQNYTGGLWGFTNKLEKTVAVQPPVVPDGTWAQLRLKVQGSHIEGWVNDLQTVDVSATPETMTGRTLALIYWNRSGGRVGYRNLRVRELNSASPPAGNSTPSGWNELFNGQNLSGWRPVESDGAWQVRDGVIFADGNGGGRLSTIGVYGDFDLELEYRLPPGGNSGVFLRSPPIGNSLGKGLMEVQLLDSTAPNYQNLAPNERTGAIYKTIGASVAIESKPDVWNRILMELTGSKVAVSVNGVKVAEGDIADPSVGSFIENPQPVGHIGLQRHLPAGPAGPQGGPTGAEFRNIRIRERAAAPAPIVAQKPPADAQVFQGHSYKCFPEKLSWRAARDRCRSLGGHLVIIETPEENQFVASIVQSLGLLDCWLGITDEINEGKWMRVDGGPVKWTNWYRQQPNNKPPGEHWALISNRTFGNQKVGWQWCDQPNETAVHEPGYLCEWDEVR
jgi:serine/threonine protein kinase